LRVAVQVVGHLHLRPSRYRRGGAGMVREWLPEHGVRLLCHLIRSCRVWAAHNGRHGRIRVEDVVGDTESVPP
jgi:hypothetical protein